MKNIDIIGIMAQDKDGLVGINNDLPWKDDPETKWDMKHFKETTTGYPIIMGYKTFITFNKPLKNRINFVIDSHDSLSGHVNVKRATEVKEFNDTEFYTIDSLKTAREIIEQLLNVDKAYLIGGATTLIRAIINNKLDKLILTTFDKSYFKDSEDPVYLNLDSVDFEVTDCQRHDNGKIEYLNFKKE